MKAIIVSLGLLVAGCGVGNTAPTTGSSDEVSADIIGGGIGGACDVTTQMSRTGYGNNDRSVDIWSGNGQAPPDLLQQCTSALRPQVIDAAIAMAKDDFASRAQAQCAAFQCPAGCSGQCVPPAPPASVPFVNCVLSAPRWDESSESQVISCRCFTTTAAQATGTWNASCSGGPSGGSDQTQIKSIGFLPDPGCTINLLDPTGSGQGWWAVTTATCVYGRTPAELKPVLGARDGRNPGSDAIFPDVVSYIVHEQYQPGAAFDANDIAVIKFAEAVPIDGMRITGAGLPPDNSNNFNGVTVTTVGYTEDGPVLGDELPVISTAQCSETFPAVGDSQICTDGTYQNASGYDAMYVLMNGQWVLLGVLAAQNGPTSVYTGIGPHLAWINDKLSNY
jgi:hypothetical protein